MLLSRLNNIRIPSAIALLSVCLILIFSSRPTHAAPASTNYASLYSYSLTEDFDQLLRANRSFRPLDETQIEQVQAYLYNKIMRSLGFTNESMPLDFQLPFTSPVHLAIRLRGRFVTEGIAFEADQLKSLDRAVEHAMRLYSQRVSDGSLKALTAKSVADLSIETTLFFKPKPLISRQPSALKDNIERGIHGLAIYEEGRFTVFSSSKALIHNYSIEKLVARLHESMGSHRKDYIGGAAQIVRFDVQHFVQTSPTISPVSLYRGDKTVQIESVNQDSLKLFTNQMAEWLLRNVRDDGRMEYSYFPSRGTYSKANNMIRQWMATLALGEFAAASGDARFEEAWLKNSHYNLENYYKEQQDFGYIFYNGKAKLGAAALAHMALSHGENQDHFAEQRERLRALLDRLREPDGSFRTFLIPSNRNDNQSFYSGEALLAIARNSPDKKKFLESMRFYLGYYRSTNRYTPFVPWHTMAYWHMYEQTGDEEFKEAIFELNDWLICIQDLRHNTSPDIKGRFYLPEFSSNGPPHASSTAVYVEGLAYAYDVAREVGDEERADAYLQAIRWGLRSLMQLQYRSENAFYLRHKKRVLGGLRTRVYDNRLRIDNTQHAIMAGLAVQRFVPGDELVRATPYAAEFRARALARFTDQKGNNVLAQTTRSAGEATVLLGGDTQLGRYTEIWAKNFGYRHAFSGIESVLQGSDALIANLECVVAEGGRPVEKRGSKVWHLRAPPHMLEVFPSNVLNVVSIANNHSMDYGPDALMEMVSAHLPNKGIKFSGAGANRFQASKPSLFTLNGVRFAFYSFTTIEREFRATENSPGYNWTSERDLGTFERDLSQAINDHPVESDVRILAVHWGKNHAPTAKPIYREMAHRAVELGFDMVVGHQAHINHGIEVYRGAPIFYDLGNFLVDFKFQGWDDKSIMPKLVIDKTGVRSIELIPVNLQNKSVNLAIGREAKAIIDRIDQLSQPYGTRINRNNDRVFVELSKRAAAVAATNENAREN